MSRGLIYMEVIGKRREKLRFFLTSSDLGPTSAPDRQRFRSCFRQLQKRGYQYQASQIGTSIAS